MILRLRLDDSVSQVLLDCLMQRKKKKVQLAVAEKAPEDDTKESPLTGKEMAARKAWLPPKPEEEASAKKPALASILKRSVAPPPEKACDGDDDLQAELESELDAQMNDEVKDEPKDDEVAEAPPPPPSQYAKANSTSHRTAWMKMTRRFECEDARAKWPEIAKLWDSCREAGLTGHGKLILHR